MPENQELEISRDKILEYLPLVKRVVARIFPRIPSGAVDFEDLVGYGLVGLIESINSFNPNRGVKFSTYAFYRIRGAILDSLRDLDWVPRATRQKINVVKGCIDQLTSKLGREPTENEIASAAGISEAEASELIMDSFQSIVISIEDNLHNYLAEKTKDFSQLDSLESLDVKRELVNAIDQLPEKERLGLTLYYFEEMNLKEIGKVLDVSESRVCQLLHQALEKLKEMVIFLKSETRE